MGNYTLREAEREALIGWIDRALDMDPPLVSICVDRKVGRSTSQQGELQTEELAILASTGGAGAILEEVVERWGQHGGRWQLRLMIDAGEGQPKRQLKRSFDLQKIRAAEKGGGARGSAQGVEELTHAFGAAFNAQVEAQQIAQNNSHETLLALINQTQEAGLVRLQEATTYQAQIDSLRQSLFKAEVELALAQQQSAITPELLQQIAPSIMGFISAITQKLLTADEGASPQVASSSPPRAAPSQE
jgi:hypothetical protein